MPNEKFRIAKFCSIRKTIFSGHMVSFGTVFFLEHTPYFIEQDKKKGTIWPIPKEIKMNV